MGWTNKRLVNQAIDHFESVAAKMRKELRFSDHCWEMESFHLDSVEESVWLDEDEMADDEDGLFLNVHAYYDVEHTIREGDRDLKTLREFEDKLAEVRKLLTARQTAAKKLLRAMGDYREPKG